MLLSPVPNAALAAVPDPPAGGPRKPAGQRGGRPGPAPVRVGGHGRMALVPAGGATGDTPGAARDHLIETVDAGEVPLWRAFLAHRCPDVRRRLVERHARLVRGVGTKLAVRLPTSIELADLMQSGTFGLMEAVDRFDPVRGVRFEGYAAQRIRGAMLDELRAQDWVPRTVRARIREVERARDVLQSRAGRPATDRELAAELGIGVRELRHAVRPRHLISAEDLAENATPGHDGLSALVGDDSGDPALITVRRETSQELRTAIAQLGERDRVVLQLYYLQNLTLAEIGALLGVTESRVCQLHARMITRLRGRLVHAIAG
ncbi:FliA/WhiG family RNA polymerase sigma factor [Pseudonocardia sp. NPDC046786]|uniref:FliA/WhiG family RNA polymerase sigma factor n=1 Tax=Pseudonocardia sp. NPDC046786 TaxID=3155471 RepID=UPI0033DA31B2